MVFMSKIAENMHILLYLLMFVIKGINQTAYMEYIWKD